VAGSTLDAPGESGGSGSSSMSERWRG
jgi:hypothetical protein